jgi:hypothetical protein
MPQGEDEPIKADFQQPRFITQELHYRILNKEQFLWLCGFLGYTDTFKRSNPSMHETRFCLIWETGTTSLKPFWRFAGPEEYNRAT